MERIGHHAYKDLGSMDLLVVLKDSHMFYQLFPGRICKQNFPSHLIHIFLYLSRDLDYKHHKLDINHLENLAYKNILLNFHQISRYHYLRKDLEHINLYARKLDRYSHIYSCMPYLN